ncbi:uroporphyrinogen III methyltransferase / synthase [Desulfonauticus submarinus]|uniref:uroporphyrinogen-III C-methyltransferase n=1 Tax=Desulfonauticus submarinus TaxID=206665 RepID=A0A1H0DGF7_9BACT|nr:uroporphyrinogen-III C-methyltransferase [Desulfonauticus submarinus]SDN69081.1 uroporphyrinogen III methyltransferase / synthase [Desulfonauticus submarinus]
MKDKDKKREGQKGKVYLIGAGPGDPGLLTLRAKEVLEQADVVVYDYLASEELLTYCPQAEIIYVGKKGGDHTLPQDKINELLIQKALAGKIVARLKGGDPYVFGRGGEEAEEIVEHGLDFEVIPGVTSAVAAPAYAGIPLTHRRYTSSVSFITGHEDPKKKESAIDWEALVRSRSTLVFFMGVKNLPNIVENLLAAGMDKDMPVALVHWGTTCRQKTMVSALGSVVKEAKEKNFRPPSLIIVGRVVELKPVLDWFEKRPLLGKKIVITRAREQASALKARLRELGACVLECPTIKIVPLKDYTEVHETLANLEFFDWLIFTSVNGVKFFWKVLREAHLDARALGGLQVAAIGPATKEALIQKGIYPDFVPDKYVAEEVVDGLLKLGIKNKHILIPRAKEAREVLPNELQKAGARIKVLPVYETVLAEDKKQELLDSLKRQEIDLVTFTSSSTVRNFFHLIGKDNKEEDLLRQIKFASIGPITSKTLQEYGYNPSIEAQEYTIDGLVKAIVNNFI